MVEAADNSKVRADPNPVQDRMAVAYDLQNTENGEKAQELGRQIKVEFSTTDIRFWFSEFEAEMTMAGIGKQWLKKTVLQRNLPTKQKEDVKSLLTLTEDQAGNNIYYRIKTELIRIYAPKPKDSYCKALTRTMVGLPSQLGNQLVDDVCKKADKLRDCCCAAAVEALWQLQLPVTIRAHVSNMRFTHATYKNVFEAADQVYLSSKQVTVAAMAVRKVAQSSSADETLPAFDPQNQPVQVAAFGKGQNNKNNSGGGGRNNKNKNNKGQGQSGQSQSGQGGQSSQGKSQSKKHSSIPDNLADQMCSRHLKHGASAWFCVAPLTCPWASKVSASP